MSWNDAVNAAKKAECLKAKAKTLLAQCAGLSVKDIYTILEIMEHECKISAILLESNPSDTLLK